MDAEITIVGAGVIGLAIAEAASQRFTGVYVTEKHTTFGQETSSRTARLPNRRHAEYDGLPDTVFIASPRSCLTPRNDSGRPSRIRRLSSPINHHYSRSPLWTQSETQPEASRGMHGEPRCLCEPGPLRTSIRPSGPCSCVRSYRRSPVG